MNLTWFSRPGEFSGLTDAVTETLGGDGDSETVSTLLIFGLLSVLCLDFAALDCFDFYQRGYKVIIKAQNMSEMSHYLR